MRNAFSLFLPAYLATAALSAAVFDVGGNTTFASIPAAFSAASAAAGGLPVTETITVRVYGGLHPAINSVPATAQPFAIVAAPGTLPTINSGASYGVNVAGRPGFSLRGFTIQNCIQAGVYLDNCPGAVVEGNRLTNNSTDIWLKGSPGSLVSGNSVLSSGSAVLVQDSPNSTLRRNVIAAYNVGSGFSIGLALTNSAGSLIDHNGVTDAKNGVTLISCDAVTISANTLVSKGGSPVQGIGVDSSLGCWLINNLAVGQLSGIKLQNAAATGLHNNTVWDHFKGLSVKNSPSVVLRNNIIQGDTGIDTDLSSEASLDSQYNDLVGSTWLAIGSSVYPSLGSWQGAGFDTVNSTSTDPFFMNAAGSQASDFSLQAGSPLQGQGLNCAALFTGDYFEMLRPAAGAWEPGFHSLGGSTPTPTPTATITPVVPTSTVTPTLTASPTPAFSSTPVPPATASPTRTVSPSITPTFSPTQYPFKRDKVVSYPNPYVANSGNPLNFVYEPADDVSIRIFDISGALIAEVPAANIRGLQGYASWDGRSDSGTRLPAGLYLAVLRSPKGNKFTRFTVVY